jgi:hypothetical protein
LTSEREAAAKAFLAKAGVGMAARTALPGDASTRRYERLRLDGRESLIFMDQPPLLETQPCPPTATDDQRRALGFNAMYRLAAGRVDAFVACAGYLRGRGLSAPRVVAADPPAGFALLEDLGDDLYAGVAAGSEEETLWYDTAVDALVLLHAEPPPAVLEADGCAWPLLTYDDLALRSAGDLFLEWFPQLRPELKFDRDARAAWEAIWAPVRARAVAGASVFCHRDYHAENLIWLPDRQGAARVGMLDFQDALRAHPAWDFSMLLHDARRDISGTIEAASLRRYLAARPSVDRRAFAADFHALGALNMARILGIFSRLIVRDGKPRYGAFMPRLWRYLDQCLADPAPAGLAGWLDRHVPQAARG